MDELEEQLKDSNQVIEKLRKARKASNTLRKHFVLEQNC
jgi:hypothetical protein